MKDYKFERAHDVFGKKVLKAIDRVFPYVKQRLYVAENKGIIPRNMYKTYGIIDDAIVKLYTDYKERLTDENDIKLTLFALVDKQLRALAKKEAFHTDTMSTSEILKNELQQLEEKFVVDADNDLLMPEELDDISYHQKDFEKKVFLYDDMEEHLISALDIPFSRQELTDNKRKALNLLYHRLPEETSNVLDLFIFGKLTYDEIAVIKEVDVYDIKKSIHEISVIFTKNMI